MSDAGQSRLRQQERGASPPSRHNLALLSTLSLVIAILMAVASVAGLLYSTAIYPTDDLLENFVPSDLVNILLGVPILLGSLWLAQRGRLLGLLLWPGALFFVLYNHLVYLLAMPLGVASLLHLALVTLSVYSLAGLLAGIDGQTVRQRLAGAVPERLAGGILAALGLLFLLRAAGVMAGAIAGPAPMAESEHALNVVDSMISPALVIGGVLLWRRRAFGYVTGLGLLFQASMLFVGLIIALLVQPFLTTAPFVLADVVVVLILGLICFVPFALFVRGVASGHTSSAS